MDHLRRHHRAVWVFGMQSCFYHTRLSVLPRLMLLGWGAVTILTLQLDRLGIGSKQASAHMHSVIQFYGACVSRVIAKRSKLWMFLFEVVDCALIMRRTTLYLEMAWTLNTSLSRRLTQML